MVETLVAAGLLVALVLPVFSLFSTGMAVAGTADNRTAAYSLAAGELAKAESVPYAQAGFTSSNCPSHGGNSCVAAVNPPTPPVLVPATTVVQGGKAFTVTTYIVWVDAPGGSYSQAYKQVTAVVSWRDRGGSPQVTETTLLYPGGLGPYSTPGRTS